MPLATGPLLTGYCVHECGTGGGDVAVGGRVSEPDGRVSPAGHTHPQFAGTADPSLQVRRGAFIAEEKQGSGGCFTNVSQALQDILLKFVYCTSCQNFML